MAGVRIFLDLDKELDGIKPDTEIALTFAAAKFNSLVSRGGTLSNKFELQKTANNKRALSILDENRSTSDKPYQLYDVRIIDDNIPIFSGLAVIEESSEFYHLRVFSGVANFFQLVGDKTLQDIDLSDLDHEWTANEVNFRRQNTSGVVYPNINYGRWTGENFSDRPHTDFFPSVYFKTLLERAALSEGYELLNYSSNRVIPFSLKSFENRTRLNATLNAPANQSQTIDIGNEPINTFVNVDVPGVVGNKSGQNTIEVTEGSSYEVDAFANINNTSPVSLNLVFGRGGSQRLKSIVLLSGETKTLNYSGLIDQPGDYGFYLDSNSATTVTIETGPIGVTINVNSGVNKIQDGNLIHLSDTVPDLTIKELFLFEAVYTNSLIIADAKDKTLEFVSVDSVAAKKQAAVDWSGKVDTLQDPEYKYRLEDYAQNNRLILEDGIEEDPSFNANSKLGYGNFQINDQTLDIDREWYTAPFAASGKSESFADEVPLILIPRYSDASLPYNEPDLDPELRYLDISINSDFLITITNESPPSTQANATFEGFDAAVANNYTGLSGIFDKMKRVEVYVRLSLIDIQKLDITRPVYLLGNYWFIREVAQYRVTNKESTKVKLLRL